MTCSHLPPPDTTFPLRVDDGWLTETVLVLARGIAADLGFDRLPILADALEDAGCDNLALLNHLRSGEPHRVECWALRRLLRTTLLLPGGVPMTFAYCPPGTFLMGSDHPDDEDGRPVHRVTLTKGFCMGVHPVTQEQWRAVMGTDPSHFQGSMLPVESVSWDDAQAFKAKVLEYTQIAVRLSTEAEWEYAARAGTTTSYYWGEVLDGTQANCDGGNVEGMVGMPGVYRETTTVVSFYADQFPHPWGLADMIGNVWEWCEDWYDRDFYSRSPAENPLCTTSERSLRVCRGGAWLNRPEDSRVDCRDAYEPSYRKNKIGFRVVFTA